MEKQVLSNQEKKLQDKFNKVTTFLGKFLFQENFEVLKKSGFIDSYTSDPEITDIINLAENQRFLFMLFKSKKLKLDEIKKIVTSLVKVEVNVVFSYELVNDYSMLVIEFPEKYNKDYDLIKEGAYSKLSDGFKNRFPITQEAVNSEGQRIGKEYTLYHHIFNKTEWLKQFWCDRLGFAELDEALELWQKPSDYDLIFNVKTII